METTKQQMMWMAIVMLIFTSLLGWRIWEWRSEQSLLIQGKSIQRQFRLTESVRESQFRCEVMYQGLRMMMPQKICDRAGVLQSQFGDLWQVEGKWQESKQYGDSVEVTAVTIQRLEPTWKSFWWWRRRIEELRQRLLAVYRQGLPEPEASLVAGVVIGEQSALPASLKNALKLTGTTHIVAASGFNVAVIVGISLLLMRNWGRTRRVLGGALLIWGYVLLCGASPPVIRAGLMGAVMLLGTWVGREYWSGWALIVVGLLMVAWRPWLLTSVSFQLSISATAGVIWGSRIPYYLPNNARFCIWEQIVSVLSQAWITTAAAMIMTAPIVLMTFGQMSWWGLVVNPLVLWLIPPLMYLGIGFGALGIIWFPFVYGIRWLVWPIAEMVVRIIEVTAQLPVSPITLPMNWWIALGWWSLWLGWWGRRNSA